MEKQFKFIKFISNTFFGIEIFDKRQIPWWQHGKSLCFIIFQFFTIFLGFCGIFSESKEFQDRILVICITFSISSFAMQFWNYLFGVKGYHQLVKWIEFLYQPESQKVTKELTDVTFAKCSEVSRKITL